MTYYEKNKEKLKQKAREKYINNKEKNIHFITALNASYNGEHWILLHLSLTSSISFPMQ